MSAPREASLAPLFERESELRALVQALELAAKGHGSVVAIRGEAGIGKTALINAFCRRQRQARILRGLCDSLSTPRPLGPIRDIARTIGGELEASFQAGRDAVFETLLTTVSSEKTVTVLVIEDAHWADEATLDLIRFLGRRLRERRCLLLVSARPQDARSSRSFSHIVSGLPSGTVQTLALQPLSPAAVAAWASSVDRPPESLHAMTGGNPFFVSELLHSRGTTLPGSIRDAVLAGVAELGAAGREVLEHSAVVPGGLEAWLVEALWPAPMRGVTECLDAGFLVTAASQLQFRHELARRSVLESMAPGMTRRCHERVLECLLANHPEQHLGQIVHHAAASGRAEVVARYGVEAAREAAAIGSHREAAAHWGRTLEYGSLLGDEQKAEYSEAYAYELYLTNQIIEAQRMRERALELRVSLQDRVRIGENARWLSRIAWAVGNRALAEQMAERAVERLEQGPASRELASALSNRSMLAMLAGRTEEALLHGARAVELAKRLEDWETVAHAMNNIGSAKTGAGDESGWADLEFSLATALEHNLTEQAARTFCNLASRYVVNRKHAGAEETCERGIAYCERLDLDFPGLYCHALRAQAALQQGDWNRALARASALLELADLPAVTKIPALVVAARVRIRRGQRSGLALLTQAHELARTTGELQRLGPIACAAAEATWLGLAPEEFGQPSPEVLQAARTSGEHWAIDEFAFWTWRAFGKTALEPLDATPFAQHLRGDPRGAAQAWDALGCPYERALALLDVADATALDDALELVEQLGATPLIQRLRRQARQAAVNSQAEPQHTSPDLTRRQHEILLLLSEGLSNDTISKRLFLSPKTVGHHVEAILERLGAKSRTEAVFLARQRGIF